MVGNLFEKRLQRGLESNNQQSVRVVISKTSHADEDYLITRSIKLRLKAYSN